MNDYQEKWEYGSSVRSRPRKCIDFTQEGLFFPVEKQNLFLLPEIKILPEESKRQLLLLTLYQYLGGIIHLETEWISAACNKIASNNYLDYPVATKTNAYTIIIDEYYHVYIARDMQTQLQAQYPQFKELSFTYSDADYAIRSITKKLPVEYHDSFLIIAVCIFETSLVREMVSQFEGQSIHPIIKSYVRDHMNDEARHYGYFYDVLGYTWKNMSAESRTSIGKYLAEFVVLYLDLKSEQDNNFKILRWLAFDKQAATTMIDSIYSGFKISPELPMVKNVLRVLKDTEVLADMHVHEGFKEFNLL